jgi:alginate O-acetyltransferase complex protein AlgI
VLFNSFEFIFVYLPVTWFLYQLIARHKAGLAVGFLGLASLGFYAWWDYRFVGLLLTSIIFNFCCGMMLNKGHIWQIHVARKRILFFGIAINIGALAYFKYANFFLGTLRGLISSDLPIINVILPLGISFFTFTQIAFLVDVYRGQAKEYHFTNYLLFVTYFPHLIAGPILHHKEMMPQFEAISRQRIRPDLLAMGLSIFALGLAKKVLIADQLAVIASPVFELAKQTDVSFLEAWSGSLSYTLQLYFDFSGYCDMAIGISLLFGIKLPINFNSPYKARSIIEFWRRWHMTLSRFLRDYLYIPLGGNRHGSARRHFNLALTMLLGGLWHGASWSFVVWGGVHGAYLAVNHGWRSLPLTKKLRGKPWWSFISLTVTFLSVSVAWVFFRAETFNAAGRILAAMFGGGKGLILPEAMLEFAPAVAVFFDNLKVFGLPFIWGPVHGVLGSIWLPPLLVVVLLLPNAQELFGTNLVAITADDATASAQTTSVLAWRPNAIWAIIYGLLAVASITALHRASEFLYYQF